MRLEITAAFVLLMLIGTACAEDYVVSNSAHGIDVISAITYANAKDIPFDFLNSPLGAARAILKVGSDKDVTVLQSVDNAYAQNLVRELEKKGNDVEVVESSADVLATNLQLAEMSGARNFIVIDTAFGYNAVSTIPYAAITDSFIIMADQDNAEEVGALISRMDPISVLQYGFLEDEVKAELSDYLTETIDTGDKYQDSIELVKRYKAKQETKQVVMADGSMLEFGMAKGDDPVLLISDVVPESVYDYVKGSDINTIILIGGDLVPGVDNMRQRLENEGKEISVFVKFGQTTPGIDAGVQALDIFPLASYPLDLGISSVTYNEAEKVLEVVYSNKVDAVAFVSADIFIEINGEVVRSIGDEEPVEIPRGSERGVQYSLDLSEFEVEEDTDIYARVLAQYGATRENLEKVAASYALVASISVEDESELDVTRLHYDPSSNQLSLGIKNIGPVDAYFLPSFELDMDEGPREFSRDVTQTLGAGRSKDIIFSGLELSGSEIEQNAEIDVHVDYGSREAFLTKSLDKTVELEAEVEEERAAPADYTLLIVVLVVVICILLLLIVRKGKKE